MQSILSIVNSPLLLNTGESAFLETNISTISVLATPGVDQRGGGGGAWGGPWPNVEVFKYCTVMVVSDNHRSILIIFMV